MSVPIHEIPLRDLTKRGRCTQVIGDVEILALNTQGGIRVYSGVCPHLGGPLLEAAFDGRTITCPWHKYAFDASTGVCRTVPGRLIWEDAGVQLSDVPFRGRLTPLAFSLADGIVQIYGRG